MDPQIDEDVLPYKDVCTPYVFDILQSQKKLMEKVKSVSLEKYGTSISSCTCLDFTARLIQCRHILAKRRLDGIPLFEGNLIPQRWSQTPYKKCINAVSEPTLSHPATVPYVKATRTPSSAKALSESQKYRLAHSHLQQLATILSHQGTFQFKESMEQIKTLCDMWNCGKNVMIVKVVKEMSSGIFC